MENLLIPSNESFPSAERIAEVMRLLIDDLNQRENVTEWASYWSLKYDDYCEDDDYDNSKRILTALDRLSGADAPTTDRPYLYDQLDFEDWLAELEAPR